MCVVLRDVQLKAIIAFAFGLCLSLSEKGDNDRAQENSSQARPGTEVVRARIFITCKEGQFQIINESLFFYLLCYVPLEFTYSSIANILQVPILHRFMSQFLHSRKK